MNPALKYACPHCRAGLESRVRAWQGWLRCPSCGKASLPPEPAVPAPQVSSWPNLPEDRLDSALSTAPDENPSAPDGPAVIGAGRSLMGSPARLIFVTGFGVSLFMLLIEFLENQISGMAIFGFLSMVFFLLLLRTTSGSSSSQTNG
jgi:hypothetical protein